MKTKNIYAILFIVVLLLIASIITFDHIRKYEIKKQVCYYQETNNGLNYPSYYVDKRPNGEIVYAFSGLSSLKNKNNSREANIKELTKRFIENKIYFVYDNSETSKKQIKEFKVHNFWLKYKLYGMTIKC